jgi:hypothetical protein
MSLLSGLRPKRLSVLSPPCAGLAGGQIAGKRGISSTTRLLKQNLVILGSGWGGYPILAKVDKKRYNVRLSSFWVKLVSVRLIAGDKL